MERYDSSSSSCSLSSLFAHKETFAQQEQDCRSGSTITSGRLDFEDRVLCALCGIKELDRFKGKQVSSLFIRRFLQTRLNAILLRSIASSSALRLATLLPSLTTPSSTAGSAIVETSFPSPSPSLSLPPIRSLLSTSRPLLLLSPISKSFSRHRLRQEETTSNSCNSIPLDLSPKLLESLLNH